MSKRARSSTQVQLVAPRGPAGPTSGRFAVRPGTFNLAGEFFSPDGVRLTRVDEEVSAADARALVRDGALVAFEGCGCGGGGCRPCWPEQASVISAARASGPTTGPSRDTPTWIDVWRGDGTTTVFLHGDLTWGALLD